MTMTQEQKAKWEECLSYLQSLGTFRKNGFCAEFDCSTFAEYCEKELGVTRQFARSLDSFLKRTNAGISFVS